MAPSNPDNRSTEIGVEKRIPGNESTVNIACIQFEPKLGHPEENREQSCKFIENAVDRGADLIVLPELSNSGYVFNSREEAFSLAERIPNGKTAQQWIELGRERGVYIVGGYTEQEDNTLYNSAVLTGPDGYIGTYRKTHLWDEEKFWFEPGNTIRVFDTKIGRIGVQVCYDQWFPELSRIQSIKGADIIVEPTNWVPTNNQERLDNIGGDELIQANYIAMSNANANKVWFACANRVGTERESEFLGKSIIVDPTGNPVIGPASQETEEILLVEDCNLMDARTEKSRNNLNGITRDRRTDLYDSLLGYKDTSHPL